MLLFTDGCDQSSRVTLEKVKEEFGKKVADITEGLVRLLTFTIKALQLKTKTSGSFFSLLPKILGWF